MRKLNTADVFKVFRILKNVGLIEEYKKLLEQAREVNNKEVIGENIIAFVFNLMTTEQVENYIYDFLADVGEVSAEDIRNRDLDEMEKFFVDISKNNNVLRFFKFVVALMKN